MVPKKTFKSACTAEMAMISFLKCFAGINKSRELYEYRSNAELNRRMPNYSVKMGFGLHVGWAIEGAIGSDFKIDASYLSQNVKLSDELEASTKEFGTPILMSGYVYNLMSEETKEKWRQIDRISIPGSGGKIRLFTWDIDYNMVKVDEKVRKAKPGAAKLKRVKARLRRDRDKKKIFNGQIKLSDYFELDDDLRTMRQPFKPELYEVFNEAYRRYEAGEWKQARALLEQTEELRGAPDGPSLLLLHVMSKTDYVAPSDWEGWREI